MGPCDVFLLTSADVSQDVLNQLELFGQYAGSAYCVENNTPGSSTAITCEAGNCPLVQAAGATTLVEYQKYA
jgi:hypothetical protein